MNQRHGTARQRHITLEVK